MHQKRLIHYSLTLLCILTLGTAPAWALNLELTDATNTPVGTLVTSELLTSTGDSVTITVIAENTPWSNNNWLGWTHPGMTDQNTIIRASLGSGSTRSAATASQFGLFLLNDVNLGSGNTDSLYTPPSDALLLSEHALSLPAPPNDQYDWFIVYDVRGLGFQNYRWHDGDGNVNSFSGDYDLLFFADDDHTAPNFDYDDFMGGIGGARPMVPCDQVDDAVAYCPGDLSLFVCDLGDICIPGFTADNEDAVHVIGGTLSGDTVCFTPMPGLNSITFIASNACSADTCVMTVDVTLNSPPQTHCPGDTAVFLCAPEEISVGPFSCNDPDGNLTTCGPLFGTLVGSSCAGGVNVRPDPTVVSPELNSIQNYFNSNGQTINVYTDQETTSLWQTSAGGASSFCIKLEMAGFAAQNRFGVYNCGVPGTLYEIFDGSDAVGHYAVASFNDGGVPGKLVVTRYDAGSSVIDTRTYLGVNWSGFGFYLQSPDQGGSIFYSEDTENTAGVTQCLTYAATGAQSGGYWLGWEDLDRSIASHADDDFNDMMILADSITAAQGCTGDIVFTPDTAGTYSIPWVCNDACGAADTCITLVEVAFNSPPVATCPDDAAFTLCGPEEICVGPFQCDDPDGNLATSGPLFGDLSGSNVCFTPDTAGIYTIAWVCTDDCGATDTCVTTVTVDYYPAPQIADVEYDVALCDVGTACVLLPGVTGGLPPFSWTSTCGTVSGDSLCVDISADGTTTCDVEITDACGNTAMATVTINAEVNEAPAVTIAAPADTFLCAAGDVCLKLTIVDPDNGLSGTSQIGTINLTDSTVCFTADTSGAYCDQVVISDSCGLADTVTYCVNVALNTPPVASCPGDAAFTLCGPEPVTVGPFGCDDTDGNLATCENLFGTKSGSDVSFTPDTAGVYTITYVCTDDCGAADTCMTDVTIDYVPAPQITNMSYDVVLCDASTLCFPLPPLSGGSAPYIWSSTCCTISGDSLCLDVTASGTAVCDIQVTDSCGNVAQGTITVNATVNQAPVVTIAAPADTFLCTTGDVCLKLTIVDPDNGLSGTSVIGTVNLTDSTVCFAADTAGTYCDQVIITDSCGLADTVSYCIEVSINRAPVAQRDLDTSMFLCDQSDVCLPGYSASDPDDNLASVQVVGGTLVGSDLCFTPVAGSNTILLIATDECGVADTAETQVDVTFNRAPVASCPDNATFTLCAPEEVCVGPFECDDPDDNLASSGPLFGTLSGADVCFTPDTTGVYTIAWVCTDDCGAADTCVTQVTVELSDLPQISDAVYDVFLCDVATRCFPLPTVTGGQPPFAWTSSCGTITGDSLCIDITGDGTFACDVEVTDTCGNSSLATITVNATVNDRPIVTANAPADTFLCEPSQVCVKLDIIDPDNGLTGSSTLGTVNLTDSTVCFMAATSGTYTDTVVICDSCGLCETAIYSIDVTINTAPMVSCPIDTTTFLCEIQAELCIGPFTTSDPDGNIVTDELWVDGGSGPVLVTPVGGFYCFAPTTTGVWTFEHFVADACGATDVCSTVVTVSQPSLVIDTVSTLQNTTVEVCMRVNGMSFPWGGFDFLVNFDPSMLTLVEATPGSFLLDCEWEYFTYRLVSTNPGLVRIVAIADMNNSNIHPQCLTPGPDEVVACFTFRVTNDRTYACQSAPVNFYWTDCGDNTISDPSGNILYIASDLPGTVVDYAGNDLTGQPALGGPPASCPTDKFVPLPCVEYRGGKIRIICPGEIDDRGDLNLNAVAYEIADAVLYSNYFIIGTAAFDPVYYEAQIAASDVNADGVPLSVADLVYLVRVITGDVEPVPEDMLGPTKIAQAVGTIEATLLREASDFALATASETDMGAGLFVFKYEGTEITGVTAVDRAAAMDVGYQARNGELRVLLHNIDDRARVSAGSGEILRIATSGAGSVELVSVEAASFMGGMLETNVTAKVVPETFALHQNYPNPFNPSTSFAIDFPTASDYTLTVFNITGQAVRTYSGHAAAGKQTLHWDGANDAGQPVASGVYLYQFAAGNYTAVRKMVLMK